MPSRTGPRNCFPLLIKNSRLSDISSARQSNCSGRHQNNSIAILLPLVPSVIWTFCLFRPDPPKSTDPPTAADVAPAVAAQPVATQQIEIETGEAPKARFDPQTGKPIPKFDPQTGKQNW